MTENSCLAKFIITAKDVFDRNTNSQTNPEKKALLNCIFDFRNQLEDFILTKLLKALLVLVGSASAIEPWTLGDLGGSLVGPSKVYDDLDTDVSIARRPEHSARSSAPKKEPVSLN